MTARMSQRGAAILAAMVTVALVAAIAAAAVSLQWRTTQVEALERSQVQARWLLRGALDWSRLVLRQDAQSGSAVDHLGEPWAIPLQPTRLSVFLAAHQGVAQADASTDMGHAQLAGGMQDLQAKLNLLNMALDALPAHARQARRLFDYLGLPPAEFEKLQQGLREAQDTRLGDARPLMPQLLQDLAWLGLSQASITALQPHATLVNAVTRVNLNTASAAVVWAVGEDLDRGQANALVAERQRQHFATVAAARERTGLTLDEFHFTTQSSHFAATGQVQLDDVQLQLQAALQRAGTRVSVERVRTQGLALAP